MEIDSAYQHMYLAADRLDAVPDGVRLGYEECARIRRHMVSALEQARTGVHKLLDLGGAGGFAEANPLQRYWRDLEIGSRHAMMNPLVAYEDYSRALFAEGPVSVVL
ncbi:hypothetical protein [Streptomyces sp. NPDC058632]|uniref:hypothetical protein n=1 Tax=unclassified Streptomyces TaxID=2593676 RepID=UPI003650F5DD